MQYSPTCDPDVVIEDKREGYCRYRRISTGDRWEVFGVCYMWGFCLIGANVWTPDGIVEIKDFFHLKQLQWKYGRLSSHPDVSLDVPVTPDFRECCPFTYRVLR